MEVISIEQMVGSAIFGIIFSTGCVRSICCLSSALIAIGFALPFSFSIRMEALSEHTK